MSNENYEYLKLSPFKWFVLQNFPFIEADFDALTEWQLFCKIGKEINKIIDSQNSVGEEVEKLSNAFILLKKYVDDYFTNLNLQDEVNTKLNEMAEDGTLEKIINQEIFGKINNDIEKIKNEIESLKIFVDNFKLETDVDDTESIKKAIEYGKDKINPTLYFSKKEYHISDTFNINYKLNIDFNGAIIYFENNTIDIAGDDKAIFYYNTSKHAEYQEVISDLTENTNIFQANLINTKINDYLILKFLDSTNNEISDEQYYLTKITNINENNYYLDFILGFDFKSFGYTAQIGKPAEVIEGIQIRNGTIIDNSNVSLENQIINGITFTGYFDNTIIENMNFNNIGCHCINLRHTHNTTLKNINCNHTRIHSSGLGYGIRLQANNNLTCKNIRGYNLRHLIDFTMDYNSSIKNFISYESEYGALSTHGQYEFILNIDNFISKNTSYGLTIGDSNYTSNPTFMRNTKNINIQNSYFEGRNFCRGINNINIQNTTFTANTDAVEHLFALSDDIYFENVIFNNGYIHFERLKKSNNNVSREVLNRTLKKCLMNNCKVPYMYTDSSSGIHEGTLEIINSFINITQGNNSTVVENIILKNNILTCDNGARILYFNATNVDFINNISNNSLHYAFRYDVKNCIIDKNKFINNIDYSGYLIEFTSLAMKKLHITNNINDVIAGKRFIQVYTGAVTLENEIFCNNNFPKRYEC